MSAPRLDTIEGMASLTRIAQGMGLARSVETVTQPVPVNATIDSAILPPRRDAQGAHVSPEEAVALDAVFRAVVLLQTDTQQLTLDVWRGNTQLAGAAMPAFVRRPDVRDHVTPADVWAQTVTSLATRGNAYWRVQRGYDGQVLAIEVLNPLEVTPAPHPTRPDRVVYHYQGKTHGADSIRHIKYLQLPGHLEGLGPIQAARSMLASALRRQGYSDAWFDTSTQPDGVLKTDQNLTAEQAAEYKQQWMASNGPDKGPAVLGRGLEYTPLHLKPSELQWLEASQQSVTSVARLFGIPPRMLAAAVEGSAMTYSNLEQDEIAYVRHTLMGYLRPIEVAVSELLPRGTEARWNVDALLRSDTKSRYDAHAVGLSAGFLDVDEVRAIEGLPVRTDLPARQEATA